MRKLYENFHFFHFQKQIVSLETIRVNTVVQKPCWGIFLDLELVFGKIPVRGVISIISSHQIMSVWPSISF